MNLKMTKHDVNFVRLHPVHRICDALRMDSYREGQQPAAVDVREVGERPTGTIIYGKRYLSSHAHGMSCLYGCRLTQNYHMPIDSDAEMRNTEELFDEIEFESLMERTYDWRVA